MKTSKHRTHPKAGWANIKKLPKGKHGRAKCRFCKKEVPKGRRSFCNDKCVHQWRLRTDTSYLRKEVFKRDYGICAKCGLNTVKRQGELFEGYKQHRFGKDANAWLKQQDITFHQLHTTLWNADHIVPVIEGGGLCGLEGIQTLCIWCHKKETKALRSRLKKGK